MNRPRRNQEQKLQEHAINTLRLYENAGRLFVFAVPNGERRDAVTGAKLKRSGVRAGVSDIVVVMTRRVVFIELKTKTGKQSREQRIFEERIRSFGFECYVCRSISEILACLDLA